MDFPQSTILLIYMKGYKRWMIMEKSAFTLHDINEELKLTADVYLRTVLINKKRHYIRRITKFSRNGITFLELEKYESNLVYNDDYFNKIGTTYFYAKGNHIPIRNPELADALSELPELYLQIVLQTIILDVRLEDLAKEFHISRSMMYVHRQKAINELRRRLKNYEE